MYPRMVEIIQLLGASGLVNIPTEKTFQTELNSDLNHFLQSKSHLGEERVKLFRMV